MIVTLQHNSKSLKKNNLHHTVPSKEGSLMIENKWNGDPSET